MKLKGKYALYRSIFTKKSTLVRCKSNSMAGSCFFEDEEASLYQDKISTLTFLPDELIGESWEIVRFIIAL